MASKDKIDDSSEQHSLNEEIEENLSISEHISIGSISDNPSESHENLTKNISKKRQLFDIDDDDDNDADNPFGANIASSFKFDDANLDALLSGDNIAQHFKVTDDDAQHPDGNIVSSSSLLPDETDKDSLDAALDELGSLTLPENENAITPMQENAAKNISLMSSEKQISERNQTKTTSDAIGADTKLDAQSADANSLKLMEKSFEVAVSGGDSKRTQPKSATSNKEISPFKDDVILINNEKVSLKSLKLQQNDENSDDVTVTTNQNTTNDVSDIGIDECSPNPLGMINRLTKSMDESATRERCEVIRRCTSLNDEVQLADFISSTVEQMEDDKNDDSIEEDHSIEELIVSNASIEHSHGAKAPLGANHDRTLDINLSLDLGTQDLSELDANIDINNESQMNRILNETVLDKLPDKMFVAAEPIDSMDSNISMEDFKEKILQNAGTTEGPKSKLVRDYSLEDHTEDELVEASAIVIKAMENVVDLREALDDITEESDASEPKVYTIVDGSNTAEQLEKGQEIRRIIGANVLPDHIDDGKFVADESAHNSFDSVISLNMLQQMENRVKELQDIVSGKDLCLAALNMQLESCSRRDSLRELPPSGRDSCSLATSSTEYRTYQEDYATKVSDCKCTKYIPDLHALSVHRFSISNRN